MTGVSTLTWQAESGSHIIVEWTDWALYADPTARLSFRVTIGLDGGWVLFQYMRMEGADGSSATIGIQDRYQDPYTTYSFNTPASIVTGVATTGTALQAILFDVDADGDQLPAHLETLSSSSDALFDTDAGGVSDVAEYVNGTDLSDPGDDVATDTDSDGLSDVDEGFWGTDPNSADTDGDTLTDSDEIQNLGTDPTLADTDGDTYTDDAEITAGTDPNSAGDFPVISFAVSGVTKHKVRATTCDDGNVHVLAMDDGYEESLYYYALDASGTVLIAETELMLDGRNVKHPGIACWGSTVYLTYERLYEPPQGDDDDSGAVATRDNIAVLGIIALDPSLDDQDGSAADGTAITTGSAVLDIDGNPRHHRVAAGANGLHFVYELHVDPYPDGNGDEEQVGYAHVDYSFVEQAELVLAEFPRKKGDGSAIFGTHKGHAPVVVVDDAGIAHVVFSAQTAPYYQYVDELNYPNGMWYAAVSGTAVEGPHYVGHGMLERIDLALDGSLLTFSIAAGYDTNHDFYKTQGLRVGIMNTAGYQTMPRVGSQYDFDTSAIDPGSFVLPIAPVFLHNQSMQGATVLQLADGVTIHAYAKNWADDLCMIAIGADGSALGDEVCFFEEDSTHYTRYKGLVDLGSGAIGVAFNDWNSDMSFASIQADVLYDPSNVPDYPERSAPEFVSAAPTYAVVGEDYLYAPVATDPDDDIEGFSVVSGPAGATFDGTTLSWTPTAADAGDASVELEVADLFGLTDSQSWTISVYDPDATGDDDDSTAAADDDDSTAAGDDDDDGTGCDCNNSLAGGSHANSALALLFVLGAAVRRIRRCA